MGFLEWKREKKNTLKHEMIEDIAGKQKNSRERKKE